MLHTYVPCRTNETLRADRLCIDTHPELHKIDIALFDHAYIQCSDHCDVIWGDGNVDPDVLVQPAQQGSLHTVLSAVYPVRRLDVACCQHVLMNGGVIVYSPIHLCMLLCVVNLSFSTLVCPYVSLTVLRLSLS